MWEWLSPEWFTVSKLSGFSWVDPYFLYGIFAVPILLWLRNVFHGRSAQYLNISLVEEERPFSWSVSLRLLFPLSVFLVISLILVALARPQIIRNVTEQDAEAIDIVLALDVSESMNEADLKPNRLVAAKAVAKSFVRGRLQDRIGLVVFAGEAFTLCPLTSDYDLLLGFLDDISLSTIATSGTAIGSALAVSTNRLRESQAKSKVIILLSDGDNTGGNLDPITAAKLAAAFGIKIYTIAVGLTRPVRISNDSLSSVMPTKTTDENNLHQIAQQTGSQFFKANDNAALQAIFRQIDTFERVKVTNRRYQEVRDYYRVYLNWAVVFFFFALLTKVLFIANVLED
jgi:Ca-activated chloride channel homolog